MAPRLTPPHKDEKVRARFALKSKDGPGIVPTRSLILTLLEHTGTSPIQVTRNLSYAATLTYN